MLRIIIISITFYSSALLVAVVILLLCVDRYDTAMCLSVASIASIQLRLFDFTLKSLSLFHQVLCDGQYKIDFIVTADSSVERIYNEAAGIC